MASKNVIKDWFRTGLRPTQEQFWSWMDSYWHKDEVIPQSSIQNLTDDLGDKAERAALESHLTDPDAHAELFAAVTTTYRHVGLGIVLDTDSLTVPDLVGAALDGVAYQNQMITEGIDFDSETGVLSGYPFMAGTKILILYTKL